MEWVYRELAMEVDGYAQVLALPDGRTLAVIITAASLTHGQRAATRRLLHADCRAAASSRSRHIT